MNKTIEILKLRIAVIEDQIAHKRTEIKQHREEIFVLEAKIVELELELANHKSAIEKLI